MKCSIFWKLDTNIACPTYSKLEMAGVLSLFYLWSNSSFNETQIKTVIKTEQRKLALVYAS